jgi:hypothetical protein
LTIVPSKLHHCVFTILAFSSSYHCIYIVLSSSFQQLTFAFSPSCSCNFIIVRHPDIAFTALPSGNYTSYWVFIIV